MITSLPSRGLRDIGAGLLAGGLSAAIFGVALMRAETVFIMLAYFAAIPLFTAGLGAGVVAGAAASFTGIVALLVTKPVDFAGFYAAVYALPVAALTALALHRREGADGKVVWCSEGNLLTAVTLYPCIIFLAVVAAANGMEGGLLGTTKHVLNTSIVQFKDTFDAATFKSLTTLMDQLALSLPALVGCSWMFVILLSLVAAQSTLNQQKWNLRPNFSLQNIYIPTWMVFAAAGTGLAAAFAPAPYNYIGTNLCVMLCVPFMLIGLAVVHAFAARSKAKWAILILFYLILTVVIWTVLLVAGLGVLDQWVNFRQRFAAGKKKGGLK